MKLRTIAKYALTVGVCVIGFSAVQWSTVFADPDAFYHAGITSALAEGHFLTQFPWLSSTGLAEQFTDQHLLYHVALVPFMWWFDPLVAVKVAQVVFMTLLAVGLLVALRSWKLPYSWFGLAVLYCLGPFVFRVGLVKATPLAIGLLFAVTMLLLHKRYGWAWLVTIFYTWTHGGFILALVVAAAMWVGDTLATSIRTNRVVLGDPRPVWCVAAGMITGLVVNPYFPQNFVFLWQQLVQIGVVNYAGVIEVGAEWYPFALPDLITVTSLVLIAAILSIIVLFKHRRHLLTDRTVWTLCIISALLFVATLRSRRYVEYFIPFLWLWSCYILLPYIGSGQARQQLQRWKTRLGRWYHIFAVYFTITIVSTIGVSLSGVWEGLHHGFDFTMYQPASRYIQSVASPNTVVFHADWDDFPMLYYHNPSNYYVVGLDPTFMYLHNPDVYHRWREIGSGEMRENVAKTIYEEFNAEYVFIDRQDESTKLLNAFLRNDSSATLEFEDDQTRVYHIQL